jgi:hypothetical protein
MRRFLFAAMVACSFLPAALSAAPVNVTLVRWPYT